MASSGDVPSAVLREAASSSEITLSSSPDTKQVRIVTPENSSTYLDQSSVTGDSSSRALYVNVKTGSTLADLDRHHTGRITESDLKFAIHKMRWMRKLVVLLSVLVLIFIAATFGAMYVAILLTREMHVKDGRLTDNDGRVISTFAQVDAIKGVQPAPGRRLNASTSETLQISTSYVSSTIDSYANGKVNWVVPLPDGIVRTVFIQGTDGGMSAWGRCESCEGEYMWYVSCSDANASTCPINTWLHSTQSNERRLSSSVKQQPKGQRLFLDRASRAGDDGSGADHTSLIGASQQSGRPLIEDMAMDRALSTKGCV